MMCYMCSNNGAESSISYAVAIAIISMLLPAFFFEACAPPFVSDHSLEFLPYKLKHVSARELHALTVHIGSRKSSGQLLYTFGTNSSFFTMMCSCFVLHDHYIVSQHYSRLNIDSCSVQVGAVPNMAWRIIERWRLTRTLKRKIFLYNTVHIYTRFSCFITSV